MFENILGHEKQKEILESNLKNGNISHAYLFFGPEGIGKYSMALEFSKYLLNTNELYSCPDFKVITKAKDKKDIVVEQIRSELIDDIYILPASGDRKVYVINDAQNLNVASQNTLLKTLEEPPKYVTIILISSNISTFLTTVLSRVSQISFDGVDNDTLENYIFSKYNKRLDVNTLEYVNGSIGKAINIIGNNLEDKFRNVDKLYGYITEKNTIEAMTFSVNIDFNEQDMLDYLEFIIYKNKKYDMVEIIEKAKDRLKSNGNYDIIIDTMILRLIDNV